MKQELISETPIEKKKIDFAVDKFLKHKIDLMIKRVSDDDENDNYLIIEGDTGSGKTNTSVGIAYIVSQETGRTFDNSRIFFDTDKAIEFAKKTREQIIIFDEPAFGGLKSEWRKKTQINLIKLLYTARIKRHFVIFNLVKFSKFNDDIIEKAVALIRIYKRSEMLKQRAYIYIPKKRIPSLLDFWHRRHIRAYNKFSIAKGTIFKYVLPDIIDKEEYNKEKEKSIEMIGSEIEVKDISRDKLRSQQRDFVRFCEEKGITHKEMAPYLHVAANTLTGWKKYPQNTPISLGNDQKTRESNPLIIDNVS